MGTPLEELEAIYAEISAAFRTKDFDRIAKYIAPGWTGVHGEQTVTREQLLANVRGQFETLDEISWPRTISIVREDGDEVTVRAEGSFQAVKTDGREPIDLDLANEDTWQRGPDGWQNVHSRGV